MIKVLFTKVIHVFSDATEIQDIVEAIEYWENVTCIQFHRESDQVLKENGKKVVVFSKRDG